MPVSFVMKPRGPLSFIEPQGFKSITESPEGELERRVCDRYLRRVTTGDVKAFAQSVLDDMLHRDGMYGRGQIRAGWWVELPYPFGHQWVDYHDAHKEIVIQTGPPLRVWRHHITGEWKRSGQLPHRFDVSKLIDRTTLRIDVQLDGLIDPDWWLTPREHQVPIGIQR